MSLPYRIDETVLSSAGDSNAATPLILSRTASHSAVDDEPGSKLETRAGRGPIHRRAGGVADDPITGK
jgi:hypothetical protein